MPQAVAKSANIIQLYKSDQELKDQENDLTINSFDAVKLLESRLFNLRVALTAQVSKGV